MERQCNRCDSKVEKSDLPEYPYQCNECDEDLYEFETHTPELIVKDFGGTEYLVKFFETDFKPEEYYFIVAFKWEGSNLEVQGPYSYFAKTLLFDWLSGEPSTGGLWLDGSDGSTQISKPEMDKVREYILDECYRRKIIPSPSII